MKRIRRAVKEEEEKVEIEAEVEYKNYWNKRID